MPEVETAELEPVAAAAPEVEATPADDTPAEPAAPEAPAEIDYDTLAAPDGVKVTDEHLADVREFAKQNGVSLEAAQGMIARDIQRAEADSESFNSEVAGWKAKIEADKDLGGANFARTNARLEKLLTEHGPPGFYGRMKENGFLYVPDFVRTMNNIAALTEEPRGVVKGDPQPEGPTARDRYPNSKSMFKD